MQPGAAASGHEVPGPFLIVVLGARWVGTADSPPGSLPQCPFLAEPSQELGPKGAAQHPATASGGTGSLRGGGRGLPEQPYRRMRCGVAEKVRQASTLHEIIIIISANLALGETKKMSKTLSANSDVLAAQITSKPME